MKFYCDESLFATDDDRSDSLSARLILVGGGMRRTRTTGVGRHDLARVPEPVAGFPSLPSSKNNSPSSIAPVAIVDAYDQQRRVRALARFDLLDRERRSGKIDEAAYLVGREIERVFEHMAKVSGGGQWLEGDRLDPATQAEVATLVGIEKAYAVNAFLGWLLRHIGRADTRLLWIVLGERHPLGIAALAFGRAGVRGYRYTVDRFRDALAALAQAKAAKGRELHRRTHE
jgi:hypothetical protein